MKPSLSPEDKPVRDRTGWWVLAAFLGFFATFCAVDAYFVVTALRTHSGVVTEHAYERGLEYNQTINEAAKQKDSGLDDQITIDSQNLAWVISDDNNIPEIKSAKATFRRPTTDSQDQTLEMMVNQDTKNMASVDLTGLTSSGAWQVYLAAELADGRTYKAMRDIVISK